jgi:uncharacterized BrkB/YihY/UPF0761 family membrane protein
LPGLIAVFATAIVVVVVAMAALNARNHPDDTSIGWDPVEFGRAPFAWFILLFSFAVGFYWQYRRLAAG